MNQPRQTFVTTRLGTLHVRVVGSGPPAVLWHSLFVDSRTWDRIEPALRTERTLVIIDGPGHGRSGAPKHQYTLADCATAAIDVLVSLEVAGPVDWVGNAWGGHVGIVFASSYSERCRSLVTLGTPVDQYRGVERAKVTALYAVYGLLGPVMTGQLVDGLLARKTRATDPEAVELVVDGFRKASRAGMRLAIRSISLDRPDLHPVLSRIASPTLFITGDEHPLWPLAAATAAAAQLQNGRAASISGTRYLTPLEAPDAVASSIHDFWAMRTATALSATSP